MLCIHIYASKHHYVVYMVPHRVFTNNGHLFTNNGILHSILNDMDEPTNKLIGRHSYCTQVNTG